MARLKQYKLLYILYHLNNGNCFTMIWKTKYV